MKLEKFKEEAWLCNHCSMCSEMVCDVAGFYKVCPVYQLMEFEDYSARGHNTIALYLLEGSVKYNEEVADVLYKCTTCAICEEACKPAGNAMAAMGGPGLKSIFDSVTKPLGIEMNTVPSVSIMEAMRADCVAKGLQPEGLKKAAANLQKEHNQFGKSHKDRTKWAEGLGMPESAATALFVGDFASYEAPEVAQAAAKILKKAGIRAAVFGDEWSSGSLMFRTGNDAVGAEMAKHNLDMLKKAGVREIICLSADDYMTIAKDWPKVTGEQPFKVKHISMVISDLITEGRISLTNTVNAVVTYEDPCHLGRGMNIYEDPRIVLRAIPGLKLVEMYPTAHANWCCGNCGGVPVSDHALSLELGERKLPLIQKTGASVIVTACPEVKVHMAEVVKHAKKNFKVKDIVELVAEAMGV